METVFRIRTSELNEKFVTAVKSLFGADRELEISIQATGDDKAGVEETKAEYLVRLEKAAKEVDEGKVVRFSAEEFQALADKFEG